MHLKQLKLAGFKSFVDPTTVPFPSQLVAVVGPNGCGKSNIIDAVRWVMGESSAKNLRGESMTDVIFNGSSNRKALGQASVELLFDNSLGRLTGQYASYQELAVKRVVTRDGESLYYLNGTRCRRRDITDIFLGTGAGARGYSIIGQGTISRLVEARPDELRAYLEEAAGVSKYKERRRETLTRIQHTHDNLARVADIRDELDKQLQRLERQAKAAERYQQLKQEERRLKADILVLKWQALCEEQERMEHTIQQHRVAYEAQQAQSTEIYQQSVALREKRHEEDERLRNVQTRYYQLGTEIARLEENLQQHQRDRQRLMDTRNQLQDDWQSLSAQQTQDKDALHHSQDIREQCLTNVLLLQDELAAKDALLKRCQQQQSDWQEQADTVQQALNDARHEQQMTALSLQHLMQRRQDTQTRLDNLMRDETSQDTAGLMVELERVKDEAQNLRLQVQEQERDYEAQSLQAQGMAQELKTIEQAIRTAQDEGYSLHARHAALSAMIQTALGRHEDNALDGDWNDQPRLAEVLQVDKDWQAACEMVLGDRLQAVVMDDISALYSRLKTDSLPGDCWFLTPKSCPASPRKQPRLSDKIQGFTACGSLDFTKILAAADWDEAIAWLPAITAEESILTPEGYWLGHGWLKAAPLARSDNQGILVKQQELAELTDQLEQSRLLLSRLMTQRDEQQEQLAAVQERTANRQQILIETKESLRRAETQSQQQEQALRQTEQKRVQLREEKEDLLLKLQTLAEEHHELTARSQEAARIVDEQTHRYQQLQDGKTAWLSELPLSKAAVDTVRTLLHQAELNAEREKLKVSQLQDALKRNDDRLQVLHDRLEEVQCQLLTLKNPDTTLKPLLEEKLLQHHELDELLAQHREQLNQLNQQIEGLTEQMKTLDKQSRDLQNVIQQAQIEEQTLKVRAAGLLDSLTELGVRLQDVLTGLAPQASLSLHEEALVEVVNKIQRLGAINLAAIDEYETESQRKHHLDAQYDDLQEALATLQTAIEKMDKETRQRFQSTFDEVNQRFQVLFPRLFGGGRALLELTCDNLLEAGIVVMAQPPGKRNSTIHLLSGGEKAMTAVALVFAIFQLNPSPFCMLDEVDAPLDDVNVGRFCTLVKEMSQFVQFLFITHNKVTMELADHLIGVTMREPGVSRVVAVDVEQALSMSET
ncbi:chromosome segregation protein SMC [Legionella taurinensis]|uniref:Chromosome partition protein Smc n=1 Tax=Legionella taurinensis TaxID=70611 RepID=A0A3A5L6G3_9GAMM|nr:chromosome segregation protein SMC [Legionella taurinensis]RJT48622.1 chromosome segregation protein SMC [Legionella taurinensis]RJT69609.1 chromosome segregation protein SMC [Legionella taurinensis]STY25037.1 chromosome partition protein smc [Legionella taurinensis]